MVSRCVYISPKHINTIFTVYLKAWCKALKNKKTVLGWSISLIVTQHLITTIKTDAKIIMLSRQYGIRSNLKAS